MARALFPLLAVLLITSTVGAGETVEGRIQSVDPSGQVITLEDGTRLRIPSNVLVEPFSASTDRPILKEGATVKASYDEKNGERVVTSIRVGLH